MCVMALNRDLNGVELYFENRPESSILDSLKSAGYRWHNVKKCWYAKQNNRTMEIANALAEGKSNPKQAESANVTTPKTRESDEPYFPPYDSIGREKIFQDSSKVSTCDENGGYFVDICAHIRILDGGARFTDLTNALSAGKECRTISINLPWEIAHNGRADARCHFYNSGAKTFKQLYDRYFIGTETGGGERHEGQGKGVETFTPFKRVPPIKTPSKWTLAHVWKAILSGQIYAGEVDGHYSDDYAYDAATNFSTGRGIDLINFASDLIEHKSGWNVRVSKQEGAKVTLSVNCHSFNCNTLYFDEACNIEAGKQRRETAQEEKEQANAELTARAINLEPEQLTHDQIYKVKYLEMNTNTGRYEVKTGIMQWHDIFWTDTIYEEDGEREETECRLIVLECSPVDIEPRTIYEIANTFNRYDGDDERIIKSSCFICYVTGHALLEMLQEGARIPMVSNQKETFEHLEKDLRMYYQPIIERGFVCKKSSLFNVGSPASFGDEHRKLMKEWSRIPT